MLYIHIFLEDCNVNEITNAGAFSKENDSSRKTISDRNLLLNFRTRGKCGCFDCVEVAWDVLIGKTGADEIQESVNYVKWKKFEFNFNMNRNV